MPSESTPLLHELLIYPQTVSAVANSLK